MHAIIGQIIKYEFFRLGVRLAQAGKVSAVNAVRSTVRALSSYVALFIRSTGVGGIYGASATPFVGSIVAVIAY